MIIDISRRMNNKLVTYPGDPKFELEIYKPYLEKNEKNREQPELRIFTSGSHNGTHVDAPLHVGLQKGVENLDLDCFYGPCRVISLEEITEINAQHLEKHSLKKGERILLKTDNSNYEEFRDEYAYLSIEAAEYAAKKELKLIGTDGFSVQKRGSQTQNVHRTLLQKMPILECLRLKHVEPGEYMLAAFPLPIEGDGAPVRAVLLR